MLRKNLSYTMSFFLAMSLVFAGAVPLQAGLGKLWPFATKKHVKQQIDPINGRVGELEEISKKHEGQIKDVDERAQSGINAAMTKINDVDQKTQAADRKAEEASNQVQQTQAHLKDVESDFDKRIENADSYRPVKKVEVQFKFNQYKLGKESEEVLDSLASELKDSKGYILEIQGYTDPTGPLAVNLELSRQRAESVVRYLSEKYDVPLFRMRTLGMGVTPKEIFQEEGAKKSRHVEIQLLRNEAMNVASK